MRSCGITASVFCATSRRQARRCCRPSTVDELEELQPVVVRARLGRRPARRGIRPESSGVGERTEVRSGRRRAAGRIRRGRANRDGARAALRGQDEPATYVAPGASRIVSPGWALSIAACRLPPAGTVIVVPVVGGGGGTPVARNWMRSTLPMMPPAALSKTSRADWGPAASVTVAETVCQVCQPPVVGIVSVPVTLTPFISRWKLPPVARVANAATRNWTV